MVVNYSHKIVTDLAFDYLIELLKADFIDSYFDENFFLNIPHT